VAVRTQILVFLLFVLICFGINNVLFLAAGKTLVFHLRAKALRPRSVSEEISVINPASVTRRSGSKSGNKQKAGAAAATTTPRKPHKKARLTKAKKAPPPTEKEETQSKMDVQDAKKKASEQETDISLEDSPPTKRTPSGSDEDGKPLSSTKKKGKPAVAATIRPKAKKVTPAKKSSAANEVYCGAPDEPIDGGWPTGWTKRTFERKSGASKGHTDRYWYTPQKEYKLRSMVEVKRFMAFVKDTNGDEELAWEYFKGRR
jgi:hypothetical protein